MTVRVFLLIQILAGLGLSFPLNGQVEKPSEIQFCPAGFLPDKLPDLGLSHIGGAETVLLYDTQKNREKYNQPYTGTYSHHSHITNFNGIVVAMWSNHFGDEDSPGQYVRYSISKDGGKNWVNPNPALEYGTESGAVLFPPMERPIRNPQPKDEKGKKINNPANPLLGYRPHDKCGTGVSGKPNSFDNDNCGHYHLEMCANGFAVAEGKLFAVAEVAKGINNPGVGRIAREIKSNGSTGDIFWLNEDVPEIKLITPDAINIDIYNNKSYNKQIAIEIMTYLQDPLHMPQWDFYKNGWIQSDGKFAKEWETVDGTPGTCEPTYAYIMKGGIYGRFWRTKAKWLYVQYSSDKGRSWTDLERTSFPDCGSRANAGNLPDGRIYVINNVYPEGRNPLVLSISKDGKRFDKAWIIQSGDPGPKDENGRAKVDGFQYPHSVIAGDYLLVMYSINKESIAVTRIPLLNLFPF